MPLIIPYAATALAEISSRLDPIIQRGGIVAVPTETFYGLGVNPFEETAVARVSAIKGRADSTPILVLVGALSELALFTKNVPPAASMLIDAFWPGALTILFSARASVPKAITGGTGRVGIRLSSCEPLRKVLERVGPLTGTSANRTGAPPAHTPAAVQDALGEEVDAILDAGPTPGGLPSTVVEADDGIRIVREGAIRRADIETAVRKRGFSLKTT
jgi:L-threonylcarbamoyladenylate synthase